jgi:peroxiredoxin
MRPARFRGRRASATRRGMDTDLPQAPDTEACRETTPDWTPVYDAFVARLRANGVGAGAPDVGDAFPDFALPDDRGRYRTLAELCAAGPLVLSFNRGGWCPYCRAELSAWGAQAAALAGAGAHLVSIAAETGGRAEKLHQWVGDEATILCDVDHGLALAVGLAFHCGADLQQRYLSCGLDLAEIYGSGGWFLPVPATFVLDREGIVRFAWKDPDFRLRADPETVLAAVRGLG